MNYTTVNSVVLTTQVKARIYTKRGAYPIHEQANRDSIFIKQGKFSTLRTKIERICELR